MPTSGAKTLSGRGRPTRPHAGYGPGWQHDCDGMICLWLGWRSVSDELYELIKELKILCASFHAISTNLQKLKIIKVF